MPEPNINPATNTYLAKFYEPKITAYEFLKCFFACLKQKGEKEVERDIAVFLHDQKSRCENAAVLEEITFRSNGVHYYSDALEDALFNLQNGGLLGKRNPSFGKILIYYTDAEAREAIKQIDESNLNVIKKMTDEFSDIH